MIDYRTSNANMTALDWVLDEIFTPESTDDTDLPEQVGMTMIFGFDLTPDETDELAHKLTMHAQAARKAAEVKP